jgi:hypothetical protein
MNQTFRWGVIVVPKDDRTSGGSKKIFQGVHYKT